MGRDGLSVIEKATLIIKRFLDERVTALTFNEILEGTELGRGTAHRVLLDMTETGLLAQGGQGDPYRLGPLLLSVAAMAQRLTEVSERALPEMQRLRDKFGETIVLAELQGDAVVPVRRLDGFHEMRMNQEVGRRYPAYAGATGKVLLAHLDAEALSTYLANARLERITEATAGSVEELGADLEQIRRLGVGVSLGERVGEAIAASAPVLDGNGRLVCALSLSGLASRFERDRIFMAARAVKQAAEAVSLELGYRRSPDEPSAADLEDPRTQIHVLLAEMCDQLWSRTGRTP